jgi:hypothetical protein
MRYLLLTYLTKFWDFVDNRGVIRRIVLGATMWMTFWVSFRATELAMRALELDRLTAVVPTTIAAITLPIVTLGGYVFKVYLDSRSST